MRSKPPTLSSSPVNLNQSKELQLFDVDNSDNVIKESDFESAIDLSVGSHGRTAIDLDQPWLEVGVDENVEAIELEASFIAADQFGRRLQGLDDQLLNLEEAVVGSCLSELAQKVYFEFVQLVFASFLVVIVIAVFLDGHIGVKPLTN